MASGDRISSYPDVNPEDAGSDRLCSTTGRDKQSFSLGHSGTWDDCAPAVGSRERKVKQSATPSQSYLQF